MTGKRSYFVTRQTSAAPVADALLPEVVAEEPAVGQDQHGWVEPVQEAAGELALGDAPGVQRGRHHGVRAAFGQSHDPNLRKRALPRTRG
jgi:hypothetical protein